MMCDLIYLFCRGEHILYKINPSLGYCLFFISKIKVPNMQTLEKANKVYSIQMLASVICGVIAPIFFAAMVIIEQLVVPGYSWTTQYVSDLGAYTLYGKYAILQNINFWTFGILVIIFSTALISTPLGKRVVTALLALFGTMVFLAGVFPDTPALTGNIHDFVSALAFLIIPICQLIVWAKLRRVGNQNEESFWRRYRTYSLISGIITILVLVLQGSPDLGVRQRLLIAVPWLWIEVTALKLLQLRFSSARRA
jgi:hypothetical membrane protein